MKIFLLVAHYIAWYFLEKFQSIPKNIAFFNLVIINFGIFPGDQKSD